MEQPTSSDLLITIHGLEMESVSQVEIHRGRWRVRASQELNGTIHITATPYQRPANAGIRSSAAKPRRYVKPRLSFPMPLPPFSWLRIGCLNLTEATKGAE